MPTEYARLQRQQSIGASIAQHGGRPLGELETRAVGLLAKPAMEGLCKQQASGEQWGDYKQQESLPLRSLPVASRSMSITTLKTDSDACLHRPCTKAAYSCSSICRHNMALTTISSHGSAVSTC